MGLGFRVWGKRFTCWVVAARRVRKECRPISAVIVAAALSAPPPGLPSPACL